jgi:cystathionine beta-synthase
LRVAQELGPHELVVVLLPDSGRSYLSKTFSDDWMRQWGFLEEPREAGRAEPTVREVLDRTPGWAGRLVTISSEATVSHAVAGLAGPLPAAVPVVLARHERRHGITATEVLGSIDPAALQAAAASRISAGSPILDHLADPLPVVGIGQTISEAHTALGRHHPAALVLLDGRVAALITRAELSVVATAPARPFWRPPRERVEMIKTGHSLGPADRTGSGTTTSLTPFTMTISAWPGPAGNDGAVRAGHRWR